MVIPSSPAVRLYLLSYIIIIKINIYIYSRLFKNSTLLKVGLFGVTNFSI